VTPTKKQANKTKQVLFFIVLVFIVGAGFFSYNYVKTSLKAVSATSEVVTFEVSKGTSLTTVAKSLIESKLIKDENVFVYFAKYKNLTALKAGIYKLDKSWDVEKLLTVLNNPTAAVSKDILITVIPGDWAKEIAAKVAAKTSIKAEELLTLWNDDAYLDTLIAKYSVLSADIKNSKTKVKLEGYLFPETYYISATATAKQITERLLSQTQKVYDAHKSDFLKSTLSTHQVFILASIVQFEASKVSDMKMVAQVFYNRLAKNMLLQSSVTVCYALYDYDHWSDCETNSTLDSPYNTYKYAGLPVGPIMNPTEAALDSVLNPTPNDYIYFMADVYGDGTVYYAKTYAEHLANVKKYLRK